jgi:hypothetical protein
VIDTVGSPRAFYQRQDKRMPTQAIDPTCDRIQDIPETPGWSENLVFEAHDPVAGISVWAHWGRIPGSAHIWEGVLAVYLDGDELLVSRTFGPSRQDQTASSGPLSFECVEPAKAWRMSFDGMARRTNRAAISTATLPDGEFERLAIDLEFLAVHPLWSAHGNMEGQSWAAAHLEQGGSITGTVIVDGRTQEIDTVGFRDHSYGPRNYIGLAGDTWCSAVFPSGRAILGLSVWQMDGPAMAVGFVWDGAEMHNASSVVLPKLSNADGEPTAFVAEIVTGAGVERVSIQAYHQMTWTFDEPVGMTIGARTERDLIRVAESPATITWGDESAPGWLEKSIRPSHFQP